MSGINATLVSARRGLSCTERSDALRLLFSFCFNRILAHTHTHRYFIYFLPFCLSIYLPVKLYISLSRAIYLSILSFFIARSKVRFPTIHYTIYVHAFQKRKGFQRLFYDKISIENLTQ